MIRSPAGFDGGDRIKRYLDYYQPSYGVMMLSAGQFSPASLFAAGEQGAWYDPSDFSTMFQNSAGTTPVTAVEQPVGLILDKSKGLTLGSELMTNGDFSNGTTGWSTYQGTASETGGVGRLTATAADGRLYKTTAVTSGKTYEVSFDVVSVSAGTLGAAWNPNDTNAGFASPPYASVSAGNTYTYKALATSGFLTVVFRLAGTSGDYFEIDNISVKELPGNHASQATPADRPVLKEEGGKYFLFFDGTDDSLATAAIDFSATDEMSVFAGVRKLSDAAQGVVAELTATIASNNGSFLLAAPDAASATFAFDSKGTSQVDAVASSQTAPLTAVLTGLADISADACELRVNGASADTDAGDQGSGNYANAILYIGSRAGSSLRLNGRLYSFIVRGKTPTADEITAAEAWVNGKTGAY